MNINESKFRQIIREEARKVLRETDTPTGPEASATDAGTGATSATTSQEWNIVDGALNALISFLGRTAGFKGAQRIVNDAKLGWAKCKDKSSSKLNAAVNAMAALGAGNQPSKLAAALVSLSNGTPMAIFGAAGNLSSGLDSTEQRGLAAALEAAAPVIVDNIVKHSSPAPVARPVPAAVNVSLDLIYTVKSGDSISKILRDYYSIPALQSSMPIYKAFAAEKLASNDPSKITVNTAIRLPSLLSLLGKNYTRKQ